MQYLCPYQFIFLPFFPPHLNSLPPSLPFFFPLSPPPLLSSSPPLLLPSFLPPLQDEFSLLVEKWNAQRAQAVAHALLKVLYPQMEKELKTKLLTEAKDHVLQVNKERQCSWGSLIPPPVCNYLQYRRTAYNQTEGGRKAW